MKTGIRSYTPLPTSRQELAHNRQYGRLTTLRETPSGSAGVSISAGTNSGSIRAHIGTDVVERFENQSA